MRLEDEEGVVCAAAPSPVVSPLGVLLTGVRTAFVEDERV